MNLEQVAAMIGGTLSGDKTLEITGVGWIDNAEPGQVTYLAKKKYLQALNQSQASAVIVSGEVETDKAQIVVANPALAFARLLDELYTEESSSPGIHPQATIGENVTLGENVTISARVCIADNVTLGDHSVLHPGVVVGPGCQIGQHTTLHPNVTLYRKTILGDHVVLHAGVVVGADGFGYTPDERGRHHKIKQLGHVVIENHVEVGANACIDRAAMGVTRICEGVKIDNLVQVAHNCTIGAHSILVSQVGIAGSCKLGHHVIMAGQAGVADHLTIGDLAVISGKAGVINDVPQGAVLGGFPAVSITTWRKYSSLLPKLWSWVRKVKELESRLNEIEKK